MFKRLLAIITNFGIIISSIFTLVNAREHHHNTLLPKLGLVISILSLVYHVVSLFNFSETAEKETDELDRLF